MTSSALNTSEADSPLEGLIANYLQAAAQGRTPDRDELLANHPDLADELRAFFDGHDWMQHLAAPQGVSQENSQQPSDTSEVFLIPTVLFDAPADQAAEDGKPESGDGTFGDYVLLQGIARGGMGVVYKARQQSLNRVVALKMILGSRLATPADVDRFYTEAKAAGHLDHPGIVPIYEVGQAESQHYYSMAYVEGMSLAELIQRDGVLAPNMAAQLLDRIAQAIGYAHERGVIHRDLKPANFLLARSEDSHAVTITGESGRYEPKVTDFGLAKRTDADSGLTGTGQILGTPSYMSPEQAAGKMDQVGPLADIYALGAVMYCMLTGRPPFQSANPMETLRQVIEDDPLPPRRLNPFVPPDRNC